jgi:hypothetical protein
MKRTTFADIAEQIARLNNNSIQTITKLSEALSSNAGDIIWEYTLPDGTVRRTQVGGLGETRQRLDALQNSIESIQGLAQSGRALLQIGDQQFSIKTEGQSAPQIEKMEPVSLFRAIESNNAPTKPGLAALLNVKTNTIGQAVMGIVRTYSLTFTKDGLGNLTTAGLAASQDWDLKFLNNTNILQQDFLDWVNSTSGVSVSPAKDEDGVIEPASPKFWGGFGIRGSEIIDNTVYWIFDTLGYWDAELNTPKELSVGTLLVRTDSIGTTKYRVAQIRTGQALPRVALDTVSGTQSPPVGERVLSPEGGKWGGGVLKTWVNWDTRYVVFTKAIDIVTNTASRTWSRGTGFWSNTLLLDNGNSNTSLETYYINSVYDTSALLEDLTYLSVPTRLGIQPIAPVLDTRSFKVVTLNRHITLDETNRKKMSQLSLEKTKLSSELETLEESIRSKKEKLASNKYSNTVEKNRLQTDIDKSQKDYDAKTKLYRSVLNSLEGLAASSGEDVKKKWVVQGAFPMPLPRNSSLGGSQEVIGFRWRWRYLSKSGSSKQTDMTTVYENGKETQAILPDWNEWEGPIRKRLRNPINNTWEWETQNLGDSNQNTVNSVQLPISPNERIEIQVRSISEVGWPDAKIESEWSNKISLDFPTEEENQISQSQKINQQVQLESVKVSIEADLQRRGVLDHTSEGFVSGERKFYHLPKSIDSGFRDANNNPLDLYDKLTDLQNQIIGLTELLEQQGGKLSAYIMQGTRRFDFSNGTKELVFTLTAENSVNFVNGVIDNEVYIIDDFKLVLENTAQRVPLQFVSSREFNNTIVQDFYTLENKEAVWIDYNNSYLSLPKNSRTDLQSSFQWIWLDNTKTNWVQSTQGLIASNKMLSTVSSNTPIAVSADSNWSSSTTAGFGVSVYPTAPDSVWLKEDNSRKRKTLEAGQKIEIPIRIFFKFDISSTALQINRSNYISQPGALQERQKRLDFFFETDGQTEPVRLGVLFKVTNFSPSKAAVSQAQADTF